MDSFLKGIRSSKTFEDIYALRTNLFLDQKIQKVNYDKVKIGFINIPCAGYGDVIQCKKVFDYFKKWYPNASIKVCSTSKEKFRNLKIKDPIIELTSGLIGYEANECRKFSQLTLNYKTQFDLLLVIPIINVSFDINDFKKLIPYATRWNTYVMSEYNDVENGPYDLPVGIGKENLGLFFEYNFKYNKQKIIKNPYALIYIQESPNWGPHSNYCYLSFLEMISKKYSKKHNVFELVIPTWITEGLQYNPQLISKSKKIMSQYFKEVTFITPDGEIDFIKDKQSGGNRRRTKRVSRRTNRVPRRSKRSVRSRPSKSFKTLIIRGDVLPKPRDDFVGLMKGSVNDILLTGNESLVDTLTCCPDKTIWYQTAPWKQNLAYNLYLETGNINYKSFKTTCGTIQGTSFKNDVGKLIRENDFRKKGKRMTDSIMIFNYHLMKDKQFKKATELIESSKFMDTMKKKIDKEFGK
jgi:hypothetical protein